MALNKSYANVLAKLKELKKALADNKVTSAEYPAVMAARIEAIIANIENNNLTQGRFTSDISKENAVNLSKSYDNMVSAVDNILGAGNVSILADMDTIETNILYLETTNNTYNQSIYNDPKSKKVTVAHDDSDSDENPADAPFEEALRKAELRKAEMNKMRPRQTTSNSSASSSSSSASSSSSNSEDTRDRKEKKVNSNAIVMVESLVNGIEQNKTAEGVLRLAGSDDDRKQFFEKYKEESHQEKKSAHLMSQEEADNLHKDRDVHFRVACLKAICKNPTLIGLKPVDNAAVRNEMLNQTGDVFARFREALNNMPASHIKILKMFFELMRSVEESKGSNRMNFENIEIAFAPRVMEFMGLSTSEIPTILDTKDAVIYRDQAVKDDKVMTAMIMVNLQDDNINQVFSDALDAKHNQNDFSDTVYRDKEELDSKGTRNGFMGFGGWKVPRTSRTSRTSKAPASSEEPVITDPTLIDTSNDTAKRSTNNNNNN